MPFTNTKRKIQQTPQTRASRRSPDGSGSGSGPGRDCLQPGVRVGAHRLLCKVARGGFGDVWRAESIATGDIVAFKVLHAELVANPSTVARFGREAHAMTMIRHHNVVQLYEYGKLPDGRPYFVMEYLSGVDLERHIRRHGALTPDDTLAILEPLATALAAVHREGIVHRDLKALNVFLADEDGHQRVVLLDFGIAKLLDGGGPALTGARCTVGSPACMAPEQIRGEAVCARTDVYALGSLVFQMLTGQLPFPGTGPEALRRHLREARPRPSERASVPPAFDAVVVRAMAIDPSARYATAPQLAAAYRGALAASRGVERQGGPLAVPALGLYLDVGAAPEDMSAPDDALLDDLDAVAAIGAEVLDRLGWSLALEQGDSALYVRSMASNGDSLASRCAAIGEARTLWNAVAKRPTRDPRVCVSIQLHAGDVEISRGVALGGALFDLASWVAPGPAPGVVCSDAAVAGVAVRRRPISLKPRMYSIGD